MVAAQLGLPRWRGERGRTEVWYATITNRADGTGLWIHHETVAPHGDQAPYAHGWTAVFVPGAPAVVERFGPGPVAPADATATAWHETAGCTIGDGMLRGATATLAWDLSFADDSAPLYTFPAAVWRRQLLPAAQIVPWPSADFVGTVTYGGQAHGIDGHGAVARIFGHGSAQRWGWLHADLDGGARQGGGALEIVTATARRPGLRALKPLALVQLRLPGEPDWPARPLLAAPRLHTTLRADGFSVQGKVGGRRLSVDVTLPADSQVALSYTDPDGSTATCTNSERASATISLAEQDSARHWRVQATAHAEVGVRP